MEPFSTFSLAGGGDGSHPCSPVCYVTDHKYSEHEPKLWAKIPDQHNALRSFNCTLSTEGWTRRTLKWPVVKKLIQDAASIAENRQGPKAKEFPFQTMAFHTRTQFRSFGMPPRLDGCNNGSKGPISWFGMLHFKTKFTVLMKTTAKEKRYKRRFANIFFGRIFIIRLFSTSTFRVPKFTVFMKRFYWSFYPRLYLTH